MADPESGISLRGTRFLSDKEMAALKRNPVIEAMLGFDDEGYPLGSELLTVTHVDDKGTPIPRKPKAEKPASKE